MRTVYYLWVTKGNIGEQREANTTPIILKQLRDKSKEDRLLSLRFQKISSLWLKLE